MTVQRSTQLVRINSNDDNDDDDDDDDDDEQGCSHGFFGWYRFLGA